jgi:predicted O-methyltransferase YrrM
MPEAELKILERLALTIPAGGAMVEVGPFCGRSSWCWSKTVEPTVSVTCIDIWDPVEHPFSPPAKTEEDAVVDEDFGKTSRHQGAWGTRENFDHYTSDCHNITAMKGHSPDDFRDWPQDSLDLVFLDGLHHNPGFHADVTHWFWRVKPGGILCGDDCARTHPDVLWTIDDFCKELSIPFTVERRIWMIRRPAIGAGG